MGQNFDRPLSPNVTSWDKISHMSPNVKGQKFAFYLKMSNYVNFLFSSKTKYLCKFLSRKLMFPPFCYFFHVFFGFYGRIFKDDETQLFFFKVSFLIILDF